MCGVEHPSSFQQVCVLASLLQRHRSPKANQTLHDVWPSPRLMHYIYIFGGCCPLTEFCPVQRAPPMFGWVATMLSIGQHSSYIAAMWNRACHYIFALWFFLLCLSFISSPNLSGCLPYFYTWCDLSANLECRSEMCCTRLAGNTGRKNDAKNRHCTSSHN